MFQVLEVFLIHFIRHLKSLKVKHVWVKSSTPITLQYCVFVLVRTGHAESDVWTSWYLISSLVRWGVCLMLLLTCIIYHLLYILFFILYIYLSGLRVCERVWWLVSVFLFVCLSLIRRTMYFGLLSCCVSLRFQILPGASGTAVNSLLCCNPSQISRRWGHGLQHALALYYR